MRVRETRFNYFLSFSFAVHLMLAVLLSFFSARSMRKELPVIEVTITSLRAEPAGSPAPIKGGRAARRLFTGGGTAYPFHADRANAGEARPQRKYEEPAYSPVTGIPAAHGDVPVSGSGKKTGTFQGVTGFSKKGPGLPSGNGGDGYAGDRLGVGGPAASRSVLYSEFPPYPEWAQKKGIESKVKLRFWVEPDGTVGEVMVEKKGYPQLDNIAIQALKKWRFDPLPRGSGRARQWGTIEMIFTLK